MGEPLENWDYFLSRINQQDGIDEIEKQELYQKWSYLRDLLGEDWFKKEESKYHPLIGYFYNSAPWSLRWIGEFGEAIKSLEVKENFESISDRLLNSNAFKEAYYELRVGHSLFKLGISFDFLKPFKNKKTPDIVMRVNNREMFLEITKKNQADDVLIYSKNFQKISGILLSKLHQNDNHFNTFFDILKPLSNPRTEQIIKTYNDLFKKAKKSGFEEFHIPNIIDLYISKKENVGRVPEEKRVKRGRTPDVDELFRIRGTIKNKEKQLISNSNPNILLIFDSLLHPLENKDVFYSNLVNNLEETVCQFTNLSAVIIYIETYYSMDDEQFVKKGTNYIAIHRNDKQFLRSNSKIIILNEFADNPLLPHEIEIFENI